MDSENHSVVIRSIESHSEINSIKTDNIDGYIINNTIVRSPWVTTTNHRVSEYSQPELKWKLIRVNRLFYKIYFIKHSIINTILI